MNTNLLAIVKQIAAEQGEAILADPERLKPVFRQRAKNEPNADKTAFGRSIEMGAYQALKYARTAGERRQIKTEMSRQLQGKTGLDAVSCAGALDLLEAVLFGTAGKSPETPFEEKKVSEEELGNYAKHYDHNTAYRLLKKLRKATRDKPAIVADSVGAVVNTLGKLLSAIDNPATPAPMKALIIGAIGYIVLPFDLIPDMIPVVGYADDVASAAGVVLAVAAYSDFDLERLDAEIDSEE